jgi:trehalose/maltose hydrolase-like predicted phosphorylase
MGVAHRWYMSPFQGLSPRGKKFNQDCNHFPEGLFIDDSRFTFHEGDGCLHLRSMGVAHRWYMSPFQGLSPRGKKFNQDCNHFPEGLFIDDSRFTFHEGDGC